LGALNFDGGGLNLIPLEIIALLVNQPCPLNDHSRTDLSTESRSLLFAAGISLQHYYTATQDIVFHTLGNAATPYLH
jgi:hypothetical protein